MAEAIPLPRRRAIQRPFVMLSTPGALPSGEPYFELTFFEAEEAGGGRHITWAGTALERGFEFAECWRRSGVPYVNMVGARHG